MTERRKARRLGAATLVGLVLAAAGACTDNPATHSVGSVWDVIPPPTSSGQPATPPGDPPDDPPDDPGEQKPRLVRPGPTDPTQDPCLPECDDPNGCELTPLEQLEVDFCRVYMARCPDQPADVMQERGPGDPIEAELGAPSSPTRPQLTEAEAEELYTIRRALAAGGEYTVSYSGLDGAGGEGGAGALGAGGAAGAAGAGPLGEQTVTYASPDDWDPTGAIEDVDKIVPGLVVDPRGNGTNTTIQSAISDAVVVAGCPRVFIKIMPGTYREKITVPAKTSSPPVTLYTTERDASKTVIVAGHSTAGAEGVGTPLTIHQSATFTNSLPELFQARNLTIVNDYVEGTWPGDDQAAVALLNQGDKAVFDNVRVLGHRNSAYVKSTAPNQVSRAYFRDCYIEGDEDIILGRGAGVFDQCQIHSLGNRLTTGAVTASSTRLTNPHGFLIINSELTADDDVSDVYLGRQWFEGEELEAVGKVIVRNSVLGEHIRSEAPWAPVQRVTPRNPGGTEPVVLFTSDDYFAPMTGLVPPEVFLGEFGNSGPAAAR